MSLDSPLHLAAHPQPLDSVTVYSSPMAVSYTHLTLPTTERV